MLHQNKIIGLLVDVCVHRTDLSIRQAASFLYLLSQTVFQFIWCFGDLTPKQSLKIAGKLGHFYSGSCLTFANDFPPRYIYSWYLFPALLDSVDFVSDSVYFISNLSNLCTPVAIINWIRKTRTSSDHYHRLLSDWMINCATADGSVRLFFFFVGGKKEKKHVTFIFYCIIL